MVNGLPPCICRSADNFSREADRDKDRRVEREGKPLEPLRRGDGKPNVVCVGGAVRGWLGGRQGLPGGVLGSGRMGGGRAGGNVALTGVATRTLMTSSVASGGSGKGRKTLDLVVEVTKALFDVDTAIEG